MAGVTPEGYELKTLAEINSDAQNDLLLVIDPVTGDALQANLSDPSDIVSQVTAITLEGIADGLLIDEAAYDQFDVTKATDDALSSVVVLNGISRQGATASTADLTFTGTPLATIDKSEGIEVTDSTGDNIWLVIDDIVFDGAGDASGVQADNQTLGSVGANAGTLTILVTPNGNITTVTNPSAAILGQDVETDSQLRQRRDRSTTAPAIGIPASIFSAISDLQGVTFARVYNNVELTTDVNGIPPKTIAAVVVGGDDEEIAQVLFSRNGCAGYAGNTTVNFRDIQGFPYAIQFFRPTSVPIFVIVNLTLIEDDIFPVDGIATIQNNIVAYALNGAQALGIEDGFDTTGFPPGSDVLVSRLFTPINSVPGHTIDSVLIGFSPPPPTQSDDLEISFNDVSEFETGNITVNVGT